MATTNIITSDPRKAPVVAAMKALLGADTRITLLSYDSATDTFEGNAPFMNRRVIIAAKDVPNLPTVEKLKLVTRFSATEIVAGIDAFLREFSRKHAKDRAIPINWLEDAHYVRGFSGPLPYTLLHSYGCTNSILADYLGLAGTKCLKMLKQMVADGVLVGYKGTWGFTVLPNDPKLWAELEAVTRTGAK